MKNTITSEILLSKHGSPCPYCTRIMNVHSDILCPTREHVKPKSRFGNTGIVIVCQECNTLKGARTLLEYMNFLACKNLELERFLVLNQQRLKNLEYLSKMGLV